MSLFRFFRRRRTDLKEIVPREAPDQTIQAVFETSLGTFTAELHHQTVPRTCQSFIDLAEGTAEWTTPRTDEVQRDTPFYDGLQVHRVIEGFMLQTGCPRGDGRGGPGYEFADEIVRGLKHRGAGVLSMANSGPDTNGSQFFVTLADTPHLDGKHAVFGRVVEGLDVVLAIGQVPTTAGDRPKTPVLLERVRIVRSTSAKA